MKNSIINPNSIFGLSDKEKDLFIRFGYGGKASPSHFLIHKAFEDQVKISPNRIAVEHLGESISYKNLDLKANLLAKYLMKIGVKENENVGLFVERSIPMIIGLLAILKAGAAYVPQDARIAPTDQLSFISEIADTKVILTLSHLMHRIPLKGDKVGLSIDTLINDLDDDRDVHLDTNNVVTNKNCFILFTSGTTGNPNGVQVTHRNVCNLLLTSPGNLGIKHTDKVSQILNISFDMSAWEILGTLSQGATLVIRGKDIEETIRKVNVVIATPSILASVNANKCNGVRVAAVAGEPCPKPLAEKWSSFCRFYNNCGPTEVTIVNTIKEYISSEQGSITIGRPTPNNTVYILNEKYEPCNIGEVGEMWAGGDCVSNGYIKNLRLTSERYKDDPFIGNGKKMFRTRDLARWTKNGELEHFGRTDDQVKIRGFRVELDSISNVLEQVDSSSQAVTLKLNSRDLVSFVTPDNVNIEQCKQEIAEKLPYYCMPKQIYSLSRLPRTNRGKIDKRALIIKAVQLIEERENVTNEQSIGA